MRICCAPIIAVPRLHHRRYDCLHPLSSQRRAKASGELGWVGTEALWRDGDSLRLVALVLLEGAQILGEDRLRVHQIVEGLLGHLPGLALLVPEGHEHALL